MGIGSAPEFLENLMWKKFSKKMGVRRIYGIFAFRNFFLKKFYYTKPSPLELSEACDSNRICDNGGGQFVVKYDYFDSFSVDTKDDLKKVTKLINKNLEILVAKTIGADVWIDF